jgi:hypothetical protein
VQLLAHLLGRFADVAGQQRIGVCLGVLADRLLMLVLLRDTLQWLISADGMSNQTLIAS